MGKIKEMLIQQMEDQFQKASIFGDTLFEEFFPSEKFEEETFEIQKGDYKTLVTCKFNKKGYLVSVGSECKPTSQSKEEKITKLEALMNKAVEDKDFRAAAIFQSQIEQLK